MDEAKAALIWLTAGIAAAGLIYLANRTVMVMFDRAMAQLSTPGGAQ